MILSYVITMPSVGSWNGKWSGSNNFYARTRNYRGKEGTEKATKILNGGPYYYRWDDGWGASIDVQKIDGKEKKRIDRKTKGFIGYDWMIDSIEIDQTITHKSDRKEV